MMVLGSFSILWAAQVKALGVSPSLFVLSNIKNGGRIVRTAYISRGDVSRAELYTITVGGSGKDMIVVNKSELAFPIGVALLPTVFSIKPPIEARGQYRAWITFIQANNEAASTTSVGLMPGLNINIDFTVTSTDIQHVAADSISVLTVKPGEPLPIYFRLVNDGNTVNQLDSVEVQLRSVDRPGEVIKQQRVIKEDTRIEPFSTRFITLMSGFAPEGRYDTRVTLLSANGVVAQRTLEKYFLRSSFSKLTVSRSFTTVWLWLGIGGLLLTGGGVGFYIKNKFN